MTPIKLLAIKSRKITGGQVQAITSGLRDVRAMYLPAVN
jgi:hypothetical protein